MSQPLVVACIPAYNEEKNIASVLVRVKKYVDQIIVCDDGSVDLTSQIAENMGVLVIRHDTNRGYGAALNTLFNNAIKLGADIIVTLDSDNQHDPTEIPKLIETMETENLDIVIGSRFLGNITSIPGYRKVGIQLINTLTSSGTSQVFDSQSGFRAYRAEALKKMNFTEQGFGQTTESLIKANQLGLSIGEVATSVHYPEGPPKRNPIIHGLDVVVSTVKHLSIRKPALFYGIPGFIIMSFSLYYWWILFNNYVTRNIFLTNVALVAIGTSIIGLTLLTTTILIMVLISIINERR